MNFKFINGKEFQLVSLDFDKVWTGSGEPVNLEGTIVYTDGNTKYQAKCHFKLFDVSSSKAEVAK